MSQYSRGDLKRLRSKKCELPNLEDVVLQWFKQCRDNNVNISGSILVEEAEEFAKELGYMQ